MLILAEMTWTQWFLAGLIITSCVLLMVVILLQKGRGEGLAGALGGGGGGAFGSKTGDMFTWVTVVLASIVLLLSVVSNFAFDPTRGREAAATAPAPEQPAQSPTPAPMTVPITVNENGNIEMPPGMEGVLDVTTDAGKAPPAEQKTPAASGSTPAEETPKDSAGTPAPQEEPKKPEGGTAP